MKFVVGQRFKSSVRSYVKIAVTREIAVTRNLAKLRRGCWGKKKRGEQGAVNAAKFESFPVVPYFCQLCGKWHIGKGAKRLFHRNLGQHLANERMKEVLTDAELSR